MNTRKGSKINQLLQSQPKGVVFLASWLSKNGYSADLQKRYRKSNWLQSIGTGAMIRTGDEVDYQGALYALQKQDTSYIHPGGKTALSLLGKSHYLELSKKKVILFGGKGESLPAWFQNHDWNVELNYYQSGFLPKEFGLTQIESKSFTLQVSNAARALMECLYLAPKYQDLYECYEFMEGLNNLRPKEVQKLLEVCTSVKVKRLFLFLADKAKHSWLNHIDIDKIDLGEGKRSIVKGGVYIPKYQITVNKDLGLNDE
ncbi:type IV toxin-antitoxin system AbiEi family antitoxin [Fulvivirgaceae bacterium BMA10]|uniref:Type IV toxin-antitoxin system AbiEi family antitoxin n=1 Tax=Splendidivirga corallicola TaxID=3051826 RepID=A0ABT8KM06_9BACT|nr:type IV toxin-antitoxin system AbiEi family antitoxin [Fulvivirgaceae bacterium BMA10]